MLACQCTSGEYSCSCLYNQILTLRFLENTHVWLWIFKLGQFWDGSTRKSQEGRNPALFSRLAHRQDSSQPTFFRVMAAKGSLSKNQLHFFSRDVYFKSRFSKFWFNHQFVFQFPVFLLSTAYLLLIMISSKRFCMWWFHFLLRQWQTSAKNKFRQGGKNQIFFCWMCPCPHGDHPLPQELGGPDRDRCLMGCFPCCYLLMGQVFLFCFSESSKDSSFLKEYNSVSNLLHKSHSSHKDMQTTFQ